MGIDKQHDRHNIRRCFAQRNLHLHTLYFWAISLFSLPYLCWAWCPNENSLKPNCWCAVSTEGSSLFCQNITDPTELYKPVKATENYLMYSMMIFNSTLRYLPEDLFLKSDFQKILFYDIRLTAFSDGDLAFKGLEKHLTEIRAKDVQGAITWDFNQLRNLKLLEVIDTNYVQLQTITENLEFPNLSTVEVAHAELERISDTIFSKCPLLEFLNLDGNQLSLLKRSMLPNPALHLLHLELRYNNIEVLPNDFFTEMPKLRSIDLSHNKLSTIDQKVFSPIMKSISLLNLSVNPIQCDCHINWFAKEKSITWLLGHCAAPLHLKGIELKHLEHKKLLCVLSNLISAVSKFIG